MTQPHLGDFFPLDDETVRTRYLKHKAARLAGGQLNDHPRVIWREHLSTRATQVFSVWGDSGAIYTVWLRPTTRPWTAACSRGGIHDNQPDGAACSHGLAAAAFWLLLDREEAALEEMAEVDDPAEWETA